MSQICLQGVGDCPLCAGLGPIVMLRSAADGSFVYLCPMCGGAWKEPPSPDPRQLSDISELGQLAPQGITFASHEDAVKLWGSSVTLIPLSDWQDRFERMGWMPIKSQTPHKRLG